MRASSAPAAKATLPTFDEALASLLHEAEAVEVERVALGDAAGRVLAVPVVAQIASPRCDVSAMDGYAVADADLGKGSVYLRVWGESFPGKASTCRAGNGRAVRIFTGAPMPTGADRVIIQENVTRSGSTAQFPAADGSKTHVRRQGSDFAGDEILVAACTLLSPRHLLVAAAADLATLDVVRRPRVAIVATGDELVRAGDAAATHGALPESITAAVAALVVQWGGVCVEQRIVGDDAVAIGHAVNGADADIIVLCGGASVGDRDSSRAALAASGLQLRFAGVAVKPGKPVWAGMLERKLVVGLPGNPVAAFAMARLLLAPLVTTMAGRRPNDALGWRARPLIGDLAPNGPRETFLFARETADGVRIGERQDASAQIILATADTLVQRSAFASALVSGASVLALSL